MSAEIIAIANQKGGVGKTTTSINLAAALGKAGKRVLLVDIDPQCNGTSGLGITDTEDINTVYECLLDASGMTLPDFVAPTDYEGLSILPASPDLVGAELELANMEDKGELENKNMVLRKKLRGPGTEDFDYIIIDCPPSLGVLTLNALAASHKVIVPLQCEYFAMEGLSKITDTIELVKEGLNSELELKGIVLTMSDKRTNLSRQVEEDVREHFGDKVFKSVVYRNTRLGEAPSFGKPIIYYDIRCIGAENYLMLAEEIIRPKRARRAS